jgi:exopolysaccharide biosynthesis polyprenyl glycosylphosphotransferase
MAFQARGKLPYADQVALLATWGIVGWRDSVLDGRSAAGLQVQDVARTAVLAAIWAACLFVAGAYERQYLRLPWRAVYLALVGVGMAMVATAGLFYLVPTWQLGFHAYSLGSLAVALWAVAVRRVWRYRHREEAIQRFVALSLSPLLEVLEAEVRATSGVSTHWYLIDRGEGCDSTQAWQAISVGELRQLLTQSPQTVTFVTTGRLLTPEEAAVVSDACLRGASVVRVAPLYEALVGQCLLVPMGSEWAYWGTCRQPSRAFLAFKRLLDLIACAMAAPVAVPVVLMAALAVKLESRGPAFYSQVRVGIRGITFRLYKLRTMRVDAEAETGAVWSRPDDPRVTRLGRALRDSGLDELPQLWNVLKGDMSVVGPRPERPEITEEIVAELPLYMQRYIVPPGITGWAQIHTGGDTSLESVLRKLRYDLYYISNLSVGMELGILLRTVQMALAGAKPRSGEGP